MPKGLLLTDSSLHFLAPPSCTADCNACLQSKDGPDYRGPTGLLAVLQAQDGPLSDAWIGNQLIDPQKGKLEVQTLNSQVGLCSCPPLVQPAPCSTLSVDPDQAWLQQMSALPHCRLVHPVPTL